MDRFSTIAMRMDGSIGTSYEFPSATKPVPKAPTTSVRNN